MHAYRSHTCGALRASDAGSAVRLSGWVHRKRDHGGLLFVDLRDRSGRVQLVFSADQTAAGVYDLAKQLKSEYVITVRGRVRRRDPAMVNPNLPTGEIEVWPEALHIYNPSKTPPFSLEDDVDLRTIDRLAKHYTGEQYPVRDRKRVNAWIEIDRWHGWGAAENKDVEHH